MLSPTLIEQLLLAIIIASSSYVYNEMYQEKPYVVQYESGLQDSLRILNRGSYFCPGHCQVNHMHLTHEASYDCNQVSCTHHKFDVLVTRIETKKDKKNKPKGLPMGREDVVTYGGVE